MIAPFIKDGNSNAKIARNYLIALIPLIIYSFYINGYVPYSNGEISVGNLFYPLIFVFVPVIVCFVLEMLWALIFYKKRINEIFNHIKTTFVIFPGLFLGLLIPINVPLYLLVIGAVLMVIIKNILGGFGKNRLNPTLIGKLFILGFSILVLKEAYFNYQTITSFEELLAHNSLLDMFLGVSNIGPSVVLCLVGFIYLIATKSIKTTVTISYVLTFGIILILYSLIKNIGFWYPIYELLIGNFIFHAIFIAPDSTTSPITKEGQLIFGILLGIITFTLKIVFNINEAILYSILFMNVIGIFIDRNSTEKRLRRLGV